SEQNVPVVVRIGLGENAVIVTGIADKLNIVQAGIAGSVRVNSVTQLAENNIVRDGSDAALALGVNAVAMTAIRSVPTVVVDDRTVDFGVVGPIYRKSVGQIVDDEIDEPVIG